MDFKLVSKNNMGILISLLLVIILSQSRAFNFLLNTALGRAIIILFILGISYLNKIFGIVTVLFIIIMINQSDINYLEGFDTKDNSKDDNKEKLNQEDIDKLKTDIQQKNVAHIATVSSGLATDTYTNDNFSVSHEGFNIIERERNIQKGKRSNEVPVSKSSSDDIEPSNKLIFTDNFSTV
jgi:uncharacterized membrane protein